MTEINSKSKMSSKKRKKLFFVAVMLSIPVLHWFVFWLYVNLNSILMAFQLPTGEWSLLSLKTVLREISAGDSTLRVSITNTLLYFFKDILMLPFQLLIAYFLYRKILFYKGFQVIFYSHINANKFKGVETRRNGLLVGVYNNYAATQIYVTVPELVVATTLETVEGGVKLLEKSSGNLNLGELFDTSAYTQEFNFTWKVDGSEITSVNQSAYEEGLHTLELTAKNKLNGLEATAYRATLDIYDENTFTLVKSLNDVIGAKSFAGIWAKNIENIYDTVFEDRNVLKMTSKGQSRLAVLANLAHSYEYYEILVKSGEKSGKNYNISIECYIPSTANETNWTSTYNHKGVETNRANSLKGIWKEDQWITLTISLSDFLGQVKEMQGNYADAVSHFVASASGNPTYTYGTSKTTGQFFGFYLPDGGDAFTMYMTMPTLSLAE